ncbi:hypothetical protein C6503_16580 [Candidatus Poribacteria bacterium]|nr:MAG: hypothetical protein C6503_16580 [Candidatus Poribacteria bacterium]
MKKFWMNSLPLLAVLFVLTIGFTMFNNLEASPSDTNDPCPDLREICRQEANYAVVTCKKYGNDSNWCKDARRDANKACYNALHCD